MSRAWLSMVAVLATAGTALAQSAGGFVEIRGLGYADVDGDAAEIVERVRPELTIDISERVSLNVTVEAALHQGRTLQHEVERTLEQSDLGPLLELADCTWPRAKNRTLSISRASDYLSVERLHVDVYLPYGDLRVGRQALNWGSAAVVNPTDPFPEVLLVDPWRQRAGVNAARATVPVADTMQLQVVLGSNDSLDALRLALRATAYVGLADLSLVGAWRQESKSGFVGIDIRGTALVGYWLESSWQLQEGEAGHEELAVGVDYSFPLLETLVVQLQYYRNGAGKQQIDSDALATRLASTITPPTCIAGDSRFPAVDDGASDPFAPFFAGRDYIMLIVTQSITPQWSFSALGVQNLGDGSALLVPSAVWLPNGWLELALAAQIPASMWGDGGELRPAPRDLMVNQETPLGPVEVDMRGLVPSATVIAWARAHF
jgi:hypothetical protein